MPPSPQSVLTEQAVSKVFYWQRAPAGFFWACQWLLAAMFSLELGPMRIRAHVMREDFKWPSRARVGRVER